MVFTLGLAALGNNAALAHFDVEDSENKLNVTFHITPEHKPVAGEGSTISYDFSKSGTSANEYDFEFHIIDMRTAKDESIPFKLSGDVVVAEYTFPYQGTYKINLKAISKENRAVSDLAYTQKVSHGTTVPTDTKKWLLLGLLFIGSIGLVIGAIILDRFGPSFKNREDASDNE